MDNLNSQEIISSTPTSSPEINWAPKKKTKLKPILLSVLAIFVVVGAAFGAYYFSRNLNRADVPNAPSSQPQAAPKKTVNTDAENCRQGCGANEYCEGGRCRKTGGAADDRSETQKLYDAVLLTPLPTEKSKAVGYEAIPGYTCNSSNCNSGFHCVNSNTCVNTANPNLSVANDPYNCGGTAKQDKDTMEWINRCEPGQTCIGGQCVNPGTYVCDQTSCDFAKGFKCLSNQCVLTSVSSVTPTLIRPTVVLLTKNNDPENCGIAGRKCAAGVQECVNGSCVLSQQSSAAGAGACGALLPDQTIENGVNTGYSKTCCVKGGIGVLAKESFTNGTNPVPTTSSVVYKTGDIDPRVHWTNCAAGTSCQQGIGCIGTPVKTADKVENTTTVAPTATITSTVTTTVTITVTATPTATPSATVTATPSATVTVTTTTTPEPTVVDCNSRCDSDDNCSDGLICDADSGRCRKPECSTSSACKCPTATPEPTPVGCNKRCTSDDGCTEGLFCDTESDRCRKPECSTSSSCRCATATITRRVTRTAAVPTVLPETGILDLHGIVTFSGGLLLAIVGILLAL